MNESASSPTSSQNGNRETALIDQIDEQRHINSSLTIEDKIGKLLDITYCNQYDLKCLNANLNTFIVNAEKRFNAVESKVDVIEEDVACQSSTIETHSDEILTLKTKMKEMEDFVKQTKIDTMNKEVHGKALQLGVWELGG